MSSNQSLERTPQMVEYETAPTLPWQRPYVLNLNHNPGESEVSDFISLLNCPLSVDCKAKMMINETIRGYENFTDKELIIFVLLIHALARWVYIVQQIKFTYNSILYYIILYVRLNEGIFQIGFDNSAYLNNDQLETSFQAAPGLGRRRKLPMH